MSRPAVSRAVVAVLAAALLAAGCTGSADGEATATPTATPVRAPLTAREAAEGFLAAWSSHDWDLMATYVADGSEDVAAAHRDAWDDLMIETTVIDAIEVTVSGNAARADFDVRVVPSLMDEWAYESSIHLVGTPDGWVVDWAEHAIHPSLFDARSITRIDQVLERGRILDHRGVPLRSAKEVRRVGMVPGRVEDIDAVVETLAAALDIDGDQLKADAEAPNVQPDWFVPAVTLTLAEFDAVWDELRPIPGVVFQVATDRQSADPGLAAHVLGTVGPITAEQLGEWGRPYATGDIVGRSGLELAYETELRGRPRSEIRVVDGAGNLLSVLHSSGPIVAFDLVTTLDYSVQAAVEAAIEGVDAPIGFVVIDAPTGHVRASASRPLDQFDRSLAGLYPPGSTFKTITAAAAIARGFTPASRVSCPRELVAGGYPIGNYNGRGLGDISLLTAYAQSCNTAFAGVGIEVGADAMREAASTFGFDAAYSLGLDTAGGRFPDPVDTAELAAASIGQGRVQASPLHMASVAAAVASGSWHQPVLIAAQGEDGDATAQPDLPLADGVPEALREMMSAVVEAGTGRAAAVQGVPVAGKTGTAEFGDENPDTHAWFIGYSGDLAFAVLVEGGGSGGAVAAPIVARFLEALRQ